MCTLKQASRTWCYTKQSPPLKGPAVKIHWACQTRVRVVSKNSLPTREGFTQRKQRLYSLFLHKIMIKLMEMDWESWFHEWQVRKRTRGKPLSRVSLLVPSSQMWMIISRATGKGKYSEVMALQYFNLIMSPWIVSLSISHPRRWA